MDLGRAIILFVCGIIFLSSLVPATLVIREFDRDLRRDHNYCFHPTIRHYKFDLAFLFAMFAMLVLMVSIVAVDFVGVILYD